MIKLSLTQEFKLSHVLTFVNAIYHIKGFTEKKTCTQTHIITPLNKMFYKMQHQAVHSKNS